MPLDFVDAGIALEDVDGFVHTGGLHHAAIGREVAVQHG